MGDPERCNSYIEYQSLPRTIVEALFCFFIVAAYVPQYIAIIQHGTHGIASRYILFHSLFSVFTLALRVCHPIFYGAYNCVNGGPYTGWKALSSLLGILQAIVQWLSAMTLLALYIHYRSDENGGEMVAGASAAGTGEEGEAVSVSPSTDVVYVNTPPTPSRTMQVAVGITAAVVLSISFAYIGLNQHPLFDPDEWQSGSYWFPVYLIGLSIWITLLFIPNTAFLFLPAVNQIHVVKASGDHGSLSLVSFGLQGAMFVVLAGLQAARDWDAIAWVPRNQLWPPLRFVEPFFAWYGTVQTHVAYAVTDGSAKPLVRVGIPGTKGEQGFAELSDLIITSKGTASNLVGLEWNMRGTSTGTMPGVYDVHIRIGGATGTDLQVAQCPQGQSTTCQAGLLMIHITPGGGGYFQNVWAWVADHDIDDAFNDRVNVLVARGWLIESTEPVWLYGTATEHAVMYQYSFSSASTVSAGMIQTESGYFQGKDGVRNPLPYIVGNKGASIPFPGDPQLPSGGCLNGTIGCDEAWAVVIQNSTNITIDGAGLYSWFDAYDEACVDSWSCQESMVQIDQSSGDVYFRNLITIGATRMVSSARADQAFLDVDAGPNVNAIGHPWWIVLSIFAIVGSLEERIWKPNRNFFGLGDSYASGIGADCGKITEDEPKNKSCNKCKGAYPYQLAHNFPPFNGGAGEPSSLFKFYACAGAKTGGVTDPPAPGK